MLATLLSNCLCEHKFQIQMIFTLPLDQDMLSQQDQLDIAASYIKQLTSKIDNLKEKKEQALRAIEAGNVNIMIGSRLPVIELKDMDSSIEVILISGLKKNFMLYEVISVLEEEGAEVVSASFSTVGDKIFHSLHAQVLIPQPQNTYISLQILIINVKYFV